MSQEQETFDHDEIPVSPPTTPTEPSAVPTDKPTVSPAIFSVPADTVSAAPSSNSTPVFSAAFSTPGITLSDKQEPFPYTSRQESVEAVPASVLPSSETAPASEIPPSSAAVSAQEQNLPPIQPMTYLDEAARSVSSKTAADHAAGHAADIMAKLTEPLPLEEEDFLFPPYAELKRPKRMLFFKVILWMMSVVLVSMAIFFVYQMLRRSSSANELSKDNERIPYNRTDTSYAEETSLPDAPEVSADPNGPQITLTETSEQAVATAASQAYQKASVSVVCVTSYKGGSDYVLDKIGDGSGIILSADGYIATNSHVVGDDTSTGVLITTFDGTQYLGTIIGVDKKTDLAVLKIDAKDLTPAEFSDSDHLFVGQEVYAIGSPGGSNFSNSLTSGTVSAVNRILLTNGYVKYIQTDTAINPGNSGGPLINEYGRVVGMNTSKIVSTNYEGMGFSIPSNKVIEIINRLIRYGYVNDRATIGIEGTTCNLYESKLKNVPQGMVVTKINGYSPLISSDVQEQDIITALNGVHIKSAYEFIEELGKYKPGDTVTLSIFRAAKSVNQLPQTFDIEIQLGHEQ